MDNKTSAKRFDGAEFFNKILGSRFLLTIVSIVISFVIGAIFMLIIGINPLVAYEKLITGALGKPKFISYCVVYATPLIFTGLAVAFSFRTGVFNIGAEGQFVVGSMAACVVGILVPAPAYLLIPMCFIAAALAGALWGVIVGLLKTKFGINEVLSMIMFNWIAYFLSNYIAELPGIAAGGGSEATRDVSANAMILLPQRWIKSLGLCKDANWGIFVSVLFIIAVWVIIEKTTTGYELKAVGFNRTAAEYGGINVNRSILLALAISGALAGVGGAMQLLGMSKRISVFSAQEGFGFQGISVALIGGSDPLGVLFAGLFYGILKYGGTKLNLIGAPSEVINIITGTVVFFIAISHVFRIRVRKGGKKNG